VIRNGVAQFFLPVAQKTVVGADKNLNPAGCPDEFSQKLLTNYLDNSFLYLIPS